MDLFNAILLCRTPLVFLTQTALAEEVVSELDEVVITASRVEALNCPIPRQPLPAWNSS